MQGKELAEVAGGSLRDGLFCNEGDYVPDAWYLVEVYGAVMGEPHRIEGQRLGWFTTRRAAIVAAQARP
jgi:hypothetical protein